MFQLNRENDSRHHYLVVSFLYLLGPTNAEDEKDGMSDVSSDSSGSSFTSEDPLILLDEPEDDDLMELDDLGSSFNQTQPSASGELRL